MKYSEEFLCSLEVPSREEMIKFIKEQNITDMHFGKEKPSLLDPSDYDDKKLMITFRLVKKDLRYLYGIESASDKKSREWLEAKREENPNFMKKKVKTTTKKTNNWYNYHKKKGTLVSE